MSLPLVSVCIGTYNREQYISECLDSVYGQTYKNIEVVVVDDASTDRTVEIVRSYKPTKLIVLKKNSGICSHTRNRAIRESSGEYIALLDSDDAWYPKKIELQLEFMLTHPDIPLCHTYCHIVDENSRVVGIRHEGRLPKTGDAFEALLEHCWITISSVMMKRNLYDKIGPFLEHPYYGKSGEDIDFFLRVARDHPIGLVSAVLTRYRKSKYSINTDSWKDQPRYVPYLLYLLNERRIWHGRVPQNVVRRIVADAALENSKYWSDRGYFSYATWAWWKSMIVDPLNINTWVQLARLLKACARSRLE